MGLLLATRRSAPFFVGALPESEKLMKNHFHEMKRDVGMSSHEKEREQEDAYIHQDRKSFITPSLHLCFLSVSGNTNHMACGISHILFAGQLLL